jgi:hypothetical protein
MIITKGLHNKPMVIIIFTIGLKIIITIHFYHQGSNLALR